MLFEDCYWLYHIRRLRYVIEWLLSVSIDFYHCCLIDLYYADAFCHSVWYHMICVKQTYDITVSHRQLDNRPLIQLGSPRILSVFVLLSVRYFMRMDFFWQAIYLTNVLCCWNSIHRRIVDMQMMSILLQASTWPTPIKSVRARTTSRKWNSGAVERRSTVSSCRRWSAFSSELIIPMRSYVKSCRDGSIWPKLVSRSVPHTHACTSQRCQATVHVCSLYSTVCLKNVPPFNFLNNSVKTESISIIFRVQISCGNFSPENYKPSHLAWIMSPHYLVKHKSSCLQYIIVISII